MAKGLMLWLDASIAVWAIIYRNTIVLYVKELLGGFGGKKPTDDETPKEDK